ncbi:SpoIIE family protein phosphatase [Geomesophilobacter sediminis]|uniref:SpoIIE family protein phosphatase n=1 Tax=Geomesophilobacter sediminis TaxID=2798584 RepID=A0A8J7JF32_9BACT|nr:SpoIIE family protein phosphatase [Geomesophilobacter sediminis]MBJ6726443.1 SpoIIE family protein phosphatase [Geomesophilobacter sediminis]
MQLYSLRSKFILVILVISAVIGLATLFAFDTSISRIIAEMALRFGTKQALLEKNKIISLINREVALAQKMADDVSVKQWAAHEESPSLRREALTELESYRRFFHDKSFFVALKKTGHYYLYNEHDGNGRVEMVQLDPAQGHDRWFFDGLRTIDGCALNLDYNATLKEAKVWFNAVMRDDRGNKTGICGGGINVSDFLKETVYSSEKGLSTILIDRNGVIEAHRDRSIVEHNANVRDPAQKLTIYRLLDRPAHRAELKDAIQSLVAGKDEVRAFPAVVHGKKYLLAVSYLQGIGWFNVVLVDVSSVISMKAFFPIIAIMTLSLLFVIVTIVLLMNRMVLAPLSRLSSASGEIAAGRYDLALPVPGRDELGELTRSFNTMSSTILDHTNNLEAKVKARTDELSAAYRMLESSQQRLLESIRYACIIQSGILPSREALQRTLGEHFVLYRPLDLVGGDFYFLREYPEHYLLAVIDCTGHGVPGAFITMTVNAVLSHVVDAVCCDDPAAILGELNRGVRGSLEMREVDAGLDIGICLVRRQTGELVYAAAGLPLHLVSGGTVRQIRGDRQRVGYKGSRLDYRYTNHRMLLAPGDCCYLTTDGLLDEPGGAKGFGFGTQRLQSVLAANAHLPLEAQVAQLEQTLNEFRGMYAQRDDITTLGFRYQPDPGR